MYSFKDNWLLFNMVVLSKLNQSILLSTGSIAIVRRIIREVISICRWDTISKIPKKLELDIISLGHAIAITYWGVKQLLSPQIYSLEMKEDTSTTKWLLFSMGYFIHDIIGLFMIDKITLSGAAHHLVGISTGYAILKSSVNVPYYPLLVSFAMTELSTIFLNIMLIMKSIRKSNLRLYKYITASFASTFFATRIVWNPLFLIRNNTLLDSFGNYKWLIWTLPVLNCWWFKQIVDIAFKNKIS